MAQDTRPPPEQVFKETELVTNKPPDGGARAWFVMMGSFLCNGILLGIINSFGVIHTYLQKSLNEAGDPDASSKAGILKSFEIRAISAPNFNFKLKSYHHINTLYSIRIDNTPYADCSHKRMFEFPPRKYETRTVGFVLKIHS